MAGMIAIGIGCRKSCASEAIVAIVERALADCPGNEGVRGLFSLADKRGEPGLNAAARTLGFDLVFLSREALAAATPRLLTRSAAALAGGGPEARLLAPRLAANGATCAIAFVPALNRGVSP